MHEQPRGGIWLKIYSRGQRSDPGVPKGTYTQLCVYVFLNKQYYEKD